MKKIILYLNLSILTLLGGLVVTSCSSSDDGTMSTPQAASLSFKPAKASKVALFSGGKEITPTTTDGTRATGLTTGPFHYYKVQDGNIPDQYKSAIPAQVSNEEKTYVIKYIKEHPNDGTTDYDHSVYFVQFVGRSFDSYTMKDHNGATQSVVGSDHMDQIAIDGNFLNDYNTSGGPDALVENLQFKNPSYRDSYGDMDNVKTNAYRLYKITYNGKVGYYMGFDYKTKKNSGENFTGDGVYNDYVIKLTSADGNPDPDPDPVNPVNPVDGEIVANLSLNDQKDEGDFISTKLSIHVRDTADVEVFIPVPAEDYCRADDMNIVISHKDNEEKYNNTADYTTMTYDIAGQVITLKVTYEMGGIRVTASGINRTVLKYLRKNYGDGITFEVWNYYKNSLTVNGVTSDITRDWLQSQYLNNSTISFMVSTKKYINEFGTVNNAINKLDCTVSPTDHAYILRKTEGFNKIYQK